MTISNSFTPLPNGENVSLTSSPFGVNAFGI
jgi:hypothetical protein